MPANNPVNAHCVAVYGREDGLYLFAHESDAEKFAAAVRLGGGSCVVTEEPVTSDPETLASLIEAEDTEDEAEEPTDLDTAEGQGRR